MNEDRTETLDIEDEEGEENEETLMEPSTAPLPPPPPPLVYIPSPLDLKIKINKGEVKMSSDALNQVESKHSAPVLTPMEELEVRYSNILNISVD